MPAGNTLDQRVFGLAAEMLRTQRAPVRIEVVTVENTKAALEALEAGKVKLAVVRSDAAMQGRAHTVMIMRREAAVLIAPKAGKLQKITDLPNAMIGVTRDGPLDGSLLWPVLDYYGIARDKAKYIAVPTDEVANALRQKKVDAVIAVGPIVPSRWAMWSREAARGVKGAIKFIDIEEADAIAKRIPALESIEVEQGAFGGRPPRPAESFNTLGYSIRLVATPKADNDTIAELVRQLYLIRQNLNAAIPGAGLMEAPDLDEATSFLIHPGVRAYVNGEQRNWFDRYSDYIYLGAVPRQRARLGRGRHVRLDGRASATSRRCRCGRVEAAARCGARCANRATSSMRPSARRTRCSARCSRTGLAGELSRRRHRELRHGDDANCAAASRRGGRRSPAEFRPDRARALRRERAIVMTDHPDPPRYACDRRASPPAACSRSTRRSRSSRSAPTPECHDGDAATLRQTEGPFFKPIVARARRTDRARHGGPADRACRLRADARLQAGAGRAGRSLAGGRQGRLRQFGLPPARPSVRRRRGALPLPHHRAGRLCGPHAPLPREGAAEGRAAC